MTSSLSEIVGLKLEMARAFLAGSTPGVAIQVVETSAPSRQNSEHVFGDWRVLRACHVKTEDENETSIVELTVARELLEHAPRA